MNAVPENPTRDEVIQRLYSVSALHGTFLLRSGQTANNYFDKYQFEADPSILRPLGEWLADLVAGRADIFAGLELGASRWRLRCLSTRAFRQLLFASMPRNMAPARQSRGRRSRAVESWSWRMSSRRAGS